MASCSMLGNMGRCAGAPISVKNWSSSAATLRGFATANEQLKRYRAGQVVLQVKSPFEDRALIELNSPTTRFA